MRYDVAVVGAGPAGILAALTGAQKGLRVVLIEKFSDVAPVRRACCQQFVMDENYEGENIQVVPGKILFPVNGFEVPYDGPTAPITESRFVAPQGATVRFRYADNRPVSIKFDKAALLTGLLKRCRDAGVEFHGATVVRNAEDTGSEVAIHAFRQGRRVTYIARKLIAADGVNSTVAASLGMNHGRPFFATALCVMYHMEGVRDFDPGAMTWYMGRTFGSYAPVILDPTLEGPNRADLLVMGSGMQKPADIFRAFTTASPRAFMFQEARVIGKTACAVKAYGSLLTPHRVNALIIGDAAAYVEVEVQGALMCGYHAGNAVCEELGGRDGFKRYTRWWQNAFEFNGEQALRVAQGYALVPAYEDDEIDYLFGLVADQPLDGAYGQYRAPKLLWDAILKHRERIAAERPELFKKIEHMTSLTLSAMFETDASPSG